MPKSMEEGRNPFSVGKKPLCEHIHTSGLLMHLGEKMSLNWKNSVCWQCPVSWLQGSAGAGQSVTALQRSWAASADLLL